MRFLAPLLVLSVLPAAIAAPPPVTIRPIQAPAPARPEMVLQLPQNGGNFSVAFTPDGRGLITADGEKLRLWDNRTHDQLRVWQSPRHGASAAAFTPDGKLIACIGSTGPKTTTLLFRDPATGKVVRTLECQAPFDQFVFSPNGKTLAAGGYERNAVLIDTATGRTLRTLAIGKGTLSALQFSRNGRLCVGDARGWSSTGAGDGSIVHGDVSVIDPSTGRVRRTFPHTYAGALSPDGRTLLVAGERLTLWDTRSWKVLRRASLAQGEDASVAAFSPDGRWLATGGGAEDGGAVTLRDSRTLRKIHAFYTGWAHQLAFSPRSDRLAVSGGHSTAMLTVWDVRAGKQLRASEWEDDPINGLALHPDQRTLAVGNGWYSSAGGGSTTHGHVALWNLASGRLERRFAPRDSHSGLSWNCVSQVRFSGDGKVMGVATGQGSRGYSLWRYPALTPIRSWDGEVAWQERMALSPDAATLISGMDTQVDGVEWRRPDTRIWKTRGGKSGRILKNVRFLAAAPDTNTFLDGANRKSLRVRDTATGKVLHTLSPTVASTVAAYSPKGDRLAIGHSNGSITLWDMRNYRLVRTLTGAHLGEISTLAFSPDGRWLASAALTVKIWDLDSGHVVATLRGATGAVTEVTFARGGTHVVAATSDRALHVWSRTTGAMLVTLRELPSRKLYEPSEDWIAYTPEGYYTGSPRAEHFIRWRMDGKLRPGNAFAAEYRSPERIIAALNGVEK